MFDTTKVLSQNIFVCHDKHTFVETKDVFCRDKHMFDVMRQNFCCNKNNLGLEDVSMYEYTP